MRRVSLIPRPVFVKLHLHNVQEALAFYVVLAPPQPASLTSTCQMKMIWLKHIHAYYSQHVLNIVLYYTSQASLDPKPGWLLLMACSHRRREKTRQFCLVSNCVHTADKTVLSHLDPVSMSPCWRGEQNWRRDKTVLSCRVGGVNTTADKTRQLCLVSNCVHTANSTRRDSFVSSTSAVWTSHNMHRICMLLYRLVSLLLYYCCLVIIHRTCMIQSENVCYTYEYKETYTWQSGQGSDL